MPSPGAPRPERKVPKGVRVYTSGERGSTRASLQSFQHSLLQLVPLAADVLVDPADRLLVGLLQRLGQRIVQWRHRGGMSGPEELLGPDQLGPRGRDHPEASPERDRSPRHDNDPGPSRGRRVELLLLGYVEAVDLHMEHKVGLSFRDDRLETSSGNERLHDARLQFLAVGLPVWLA